MNAIRKRSLWMVAAGLGAACMVVAATAEPASAQATAAPPLTGEALGANEGFFTSGTIEIEATCDESSGTISYTATGPAFGLYAGTYSETGTATLATMFGFQTVTLFQAEFTIDSPIGHVEGTKEFTAGVHSAFCGEDPFGRFDGFIIQAASYTAEITTATGTCTTQGRTRVQVLERSGSILQPNESFVESFDSGTVPVCTPICPADEDDDGDGLTNRRETLFSTLLRNSDSDRDGIADGNDDANGNGEDDEDEDDDENDDCPDEDSDDDGEDDEDEDDEEEDDDD